MPTSGVEESVKDGGDGGCQDLEQRFHLGWADAIYPAVYHKVDSRMGVCTGQG